MARILCGKTIFSVVRSVVTCLPPQLLTLPAVVQAEVYTYTTTNGTITITGYTGSGCAVSIPCTINGLPATGIGDWAFSYCASWSTLRDQTARRLVARKGTEL